MRPPLGGARRPAARGDTRDQRDHADRHGDPGRPANSHLRVPFALLVSLTVLLARLCFAPAFLARLPARRFPFDAARPEPLLSRAAHRLSRSPHDLDGRFPPRSLLPGPETAVRGPGHGALVPRSYLFVQALGGAATRRGARPRPFGSARERALRLALGLPPGSRRERDISQEPDERREGAPPKAPAI